MSRKTQWKKWAAFLLCAGLALPFGGCQEDPEGSIVIHKDMDKLVSQAENSGPERVSAKDVAEEVAQSYETYQATLENEGLGVKVQVDAQVEIPKVEELSIYRVEQNAFSQEMVDKVRAEFLGGEPLYSGEALSIRTKELLEEEIKAARQDMANVEAEMQQAAGGEWEYTEEDLQQAKASYQETIDALQAEYENAPSRLDWEDYPFDGRLRSVREAYEADPESPYYSWLYSLNETGEIYYGITSGANGKFCSLYVQNDEDHSNKLMFRSCPLGHADLRGVTVESTSLSGSSDARDMAMRKELEALWQEKGIPGTVLTNGLGLSAGVEFQAMPGWTVELSQKEAQKQAEDLLQKLGITGFVLEEGGLFSELSLVAGAVDLPKNTIPYGTYYILRYCREIDGVALSQSSGEKYADGWDQGGQFNKQMWPGECIEFRINDAGVVGFDYLAPLQVTETVVDGAALKPFSEIKETFEQMLPVTLGSTDWQQVIQVEKARLSYSRISEKDSFQTGLVVPVWSFEGENSVYSQGVLSHVESGTLLAVNAIDGSVIDAALGY